MLGAAVGRVEWLRDYYLARMAEYEVGHAEARVDLEPLRVLVELEGYRGLLRYASEYVEERLRLYRAGRVGSTSSLRPVHVSVPAAAYRDAGLEAALHGVYGGRLESYTPDTAPGPAVSLRPVAASVVVGPSTAYYTAVEAGTAHAARYTPASAASRAEVPTGGGGSGPVKRLVLDSWLAKAAQEYGADLGVDASVEGSELARVYEAILEKIMNAEPGERERIAEALGYKSVGEAVRDLKRKIRELRGAKVVLGHASYRGLADAVKGLANDVKSMILAMKPVVRKEDREQVLGRLDEYYAEAEALGDLLSMSGLVFKVAYCKSSNACMKVWRRLYGDRDPQEALLHPEMIDRVEEAMADDLSRALWWLEAAYREVKSKFEYAASRAKIDLRKIYEELRAQDYWRKDTPWYVDAADFLLNDLLSIVSFQPLVEKVMEASREVREKARELRGRGELGAVASRILEGLSYALVGAAGASLALADALLTVLTGGAWAGIQLGALAGQAALLALSPEERRELEEAWSSLPDDDKAALAVLMVSGALAGASTAALNALRSSMAGVLARAAERLGGSAGAALARLAERLSGVRFARVDFTELPEGGRLVARATEDGDLIIEVEEHGRLLPAKYGRETLEALAARLSLSTGGERSLGDAGVVVERSIARLLRYYNPRRWAEAVRAVTDLVEAATRGEADAGILADIAAGRVYYAEQAGGAWRALEGALERVRRGGSWVVLDDTSGSGFRFYRVSAEGGAGPLAGRLRIDYVAGGPRGYRGVELRFSLSREGGAPRVRALIATTPSGEPLTDEELAEAVSALASSRGLMGELGLEALDIYYSGVRDSFIPVVLDAGENPVLKLVDARGRVVTAALPRGSGAWTAVQRIVGEAVGEDYASIASELVRIAWGSSRRMGGIGDARYYVVQRIRVEDPGLRESILRAAREGRLEEYLEELNRELAEATDIVVKRALRYIERGYTPGEALESALNDVAGGSGGPGGGAGAAGGGGAGLLAFMLLENPALRDAYEAALEALSRGERTVVLPVALADPGGGLYIGVAALGSEGAVAALSRAAGSYSVDSVYADPSPMIVRVELAVPRYGASLEALEAPAGTVRSARLEPGAPAALSAELRPLHVTVAVASPAAETVEAVEAVAALRRRRYWPGPGGGEVELEPVYVEADVSRPVSETVEAAEAVVSRAELGPGEPAAATARAELRPVYVEVEAGAARAVVDAVEAGTATLVEAVEERAGLERELRPLELAVEVEAARRTVAVTAAERLEALGLAPSRASATRELVPVHVSIDAGRGAAETVEARREAVTRGAAVSGPERLDVEYHIVPVEKVVTVPVYETLVLEYRPEALSPTPPPPTPRARASGGVWVPPTPPGIAAGASAAAPRPSYARRQRETVEL